MCCKGYLYYPVNLKYYHQHPQAFPSSYLSNLRGEIQTCPYFSVNNLNRDFVGTKGFSIVFQRSGLADVEQQFPWFRPYLDLALQPTCNAFYLNPLLLQQDSRVDPHVDRSLRSYFKTIESPTLVSVLYIQVPSDMQGGELVLRCHKRQVGQIRPQVNTLVYFQGDLTHSINPVKTPGNRLSLVCEQYSLSRAELREIPQFTVESTTQSKARKRK